jgi:hypothetical protein
MLAATRGRRRKFKRAQLLTQLLAVYEKQRAATQQAAKDKS